MYFYLYMSKIGIGMKLKPFEVHEDTNILEPKTIDVQTKELNINKSLLDIDRSDQNEQKTSEMDNSLTNEKPSEDYQKTQNEKHVTKIEAINIYEDDCIMSSSLAFPSSDYDQESTSKVRKSQKGTYYCTWANCNSKFVYKHSLTYHIRIHNGERPFNCSSCEKSFRSKSHLRNHWMLMHDSQEAAEARRSKAITKGRYRCTWENCNKKYNHPSPLKYHMRVHNKEKPFKCSLCDQYFRSQSHVNRHLAEHHNPQKKGFKCNKCNASFKAKQGLNYHLKEAHIGSHQTQEKKSTKRKKERTYSLFPTSTDNEREPRTKRDKIEVDYRELSSSDETDRQPSENQTATDNIDENQTFYPCDWKGCDRCFLNYSELITHRETHMNDKSFQGYFTQIETSKLSEQQNNEIPGIVNPSSIEIKIEHSNDFLQNLENIKIEPDSWVNENESQTEYTGNPTLFSYQENSIKGFPSKQLEIHVLENENRSCVSKNLQHARTWLDYHNDKTLDESIYQMQVHNQEKTLKCSLCNEHFPSNDCRTRHYETNHDLKRTSVAEKKCEDCNREFKHLYSLKLHRRIHTGEKPFECLQCGKQFSQKTSLVRHSQNHERNMAFGLEETASQFINKSSTEVTDKQLKFNKTEMNSKPSKRFGKRRYICTWENCNKTYNHPSSLKYHIRVHKEEKPFKCLLCDQYFRSQSHANFHLLENHDSQKKAFTCDHCNGSFKSKQGLNCHLQTHENYIATESTTDRKGQFVCSWENCNKIFKQAEGLKYHMLIHNDVRPFKCSLCEKHFRTKGHLGRHLARIHEKQNTEKIQETISQTTTTNIQHNAINEIIPEYTIIKTERIDYEETPIIENFNCEQNKPHETTSTNVPYDNCFNQTICKEELILYD